MAAVDLRDSSNRICFQYKGEHEEFVGGTLSNMSVSRVPRWFRFGKGCVIDVKEQAKIAEELTRSMPIDETGALLSEGITRETSRRRNAMHSKF